MMKRITKFTLILICVIFYLCGCSNDKKIAKETYDLLNKNKSYIQMYLSDQYNSSYYLHNISTFNLNDFISHLNLSLDEIINAYVAYGEKYLDEDTMNNIYQYVKEDNVGILFENTINATISEQIEAAVIGCEYIINIAYDNKEIINEIENNLETSKENIKKISSNNEFYPFLKDYYLKLNECYDLANSLDGITLYKSKDIIEEYFKDIKSLNTELEFYFSE